MLLSPLTRSTGVQAESDGSFGRGIERRRSSMLDAILIVIGAGFFALAVLYTIACDRL